ncbi:hypothetical protein Lal_00012678 [Lupinus albus]|nr:hypothetical protein Lal_00012678 [Lupinus albus]
MEDNLLADFYVTLVTLYRVSVGNIATYAWIILSSDKVKRVFCYQHSEIKKKIVKDCICLGKWSINNY